MPLMKFLYVYNTYVTKRGKSIEKTKGIMNDRGFIA